LEIFCFEAFKHQESNHRALFYLTFFRNGGERKKA
jgi:hypothetical protein